jgi:hypothetical protein
VDWAKLLARSERPIDNRPVSRAAQLGAHERTTLAGLDVLELDDLEDGPLDLDVVPVFELVGGNQWESAPQQTSSACGSRA